ncbi:unnamed protein product [Bursaphelenchus okinawaensis]|uniref:Uncharacterized protein n=1 Tax=Bursaphelenchus okinawaensis TaxID=465554 RepID=A0A811K9P7_9BILA|nr:unnamed protein product [Bursaphelenchus okinawaensis]CAG9097593.1 unnamed protein product [Bursaphelenchus okinawaensis]
MGIMCQVSAFIMTCKKADGAAQLQIAPTPALSLVAPRTDGNNSNASKDPKNDHYIKYFPRPKDTHGRGTKKRKRVMCLPVWRTIG